MNVFTRKPVVSLDTELSMPFMATEGAEKSPVRAGIKRLASSGLLVVIMDAERVPTSPLRDLVSILGMVSLELNTLHTIFIVLHAIAATLSFFCGSYVIFSSKFFSNRRLFALYLWFLIGMVIFLAGAMTVWWTVYTNIGQVVFAGLFGLAIYMVYRGFQARSLLQLQQNHWTSNYIHHIGFTLISLFEGFIIVTLINASAPGWLVALVAISGVVVGQRAIGMAESRHGTYISETNEKSL